MKSYITISRVVGFCLKQHLKNSTYLTSIQGRSVHFCYLTSGNTLVKNFQGALNLWTKEHKIIQIFFYENEFFWRRNCLFKELMENGSIKNYGESTFFQFHEKIAQLFCAHFYQVCAFFKADKMGSFRRNSKNEWVGNFFSFFNLYFSQVLRRLLWILFLCL